MPLRALPVPMAPAMLRPNRPHRSVARLRPDAKIHRHAMHYYRNGGVTGGRMDTEPLLKKVQYRVRGEFEPAKLDPLRTVATDPATG